MGVAAYMLKRQRGFGGQRALCLKGLGAGGEWLSGDNSERTSAGAYLGAAQRGRRGLTKLVEGVASALLCSSLGPTLVP